MSALDANDLPGPGEQRAGLIDGPAGQLQVSLRMPDTNARGVMVICHPHPLYGGTMDNKVVTTLDQSARQAGCAALRFNFRGVGDSEGVHDGGDGEIDDVLAVMDHAKHLFPDLSLLLAGFSFGGAMALRAAQRQAPVHLTTMAPALNYWGSETVAAPDCPWLLLHGDADDVVDCEDTLRRAREADPAPETVILPGVGHFFHGQLSAIREQVVPALQGALDLT